jgi:hypothetical protein
MAYTTINKSTDYFNSKLISGNGGTQSLTGVGFKPDFTWIKSRSRVDPHSLTDIVRGVASQLDSSLTAVATTHSDAITSFNSDGFSLGSQADVNRSGTTFASWNWLAGGSQGSSNTAGSINTTYTSVNTTAGFSISKFTGTGSNATVGHGLGSVPKMIIIKDIGASSSWIVGHNSLGFTKNLFLQSTEASNTSSTIFQNTTPTSSVFSVGTSGHVNGSGNNYIAYCFAEKAGYSKFGSYDGNGNTNGNFIYTGFKPKFIIIKRTDNTAPWVMLDTARADVANANVVDQVLYTNDSQAEFSSATRAVDLVSNGIKIRGDGGDINTNGGSYIYMAFGQSIVGSNNIPATAR